MSEPFTPPEQFGPNTWLIDEMYRELQERPDQVGVGWQEFFSDYRPAPGHSAPAPASAPTAPSTPVARQTALPPDAVPLVGPARRLAENMEASLAVPTATSVRTVAVKLMEENRALLNQHLAEDTGGKVSFTHLVAYALVRALANHPAMRTVYLEAAGGPHKRTLPYVNLGLAVDVQRRDGSRGLVVPAVRNAQAMSFAGFFAAVNDVVRKAQRSQLTPEDFQDVTQSLTNPGMMGTTHSLARLMSGQSFILAAGAIAWPAEYQHADERTLARLGLSKVMTLTCTYDHRVIQGADSAAYLREVTELLAGEHRFYEDVFASLEVPHEPLRLSDDRNPYLGEDGAAALADKQVAVMQLINMYRVRGHLLAHTNPLATAVPTHPELEMSRYGLTVWDLDREFATGGLAGEGRLPLREIIAILRQAYCGTIAIEYMHIQEPDQKAWIQQRVEGVEWGKLVGREDKKRILQDLNAAEAFERFLHTKYVGHKRFSLEGGEVLIPVLDRLIGEAITMGATEVVMGMAHRGRLNVLANILGKPMERIFGEFEGNLDPQSREGTGDVKYHLGAVGSYTGPDGRQARVTLACNPSHLEAASPVVEGMARAIQDQIGDTSHIRVVPVLVHGDAAFAGQGVVAETLNMSALQGYRTGGTVHVVVNNGIGFTTTPADARSSVYATDVAKMVQAPVFHVNGEDPEGCFAVATLAMAFRYAFRKDVVIDIQCYRKWGHNEGDEPAFTQPLMYARIRDRRSVRKLYTERLVNRGHLTLEEAEAALGDFQRRLDAAFEATDHGHAPAAHVRTAPPPPAPPLPVPPEIEAGQLQVVMDRLCTLPADFQAHPKLVRLFEQRRRMLAHDAVDWGAAEALAFGTLLAEGFTVRLSGQDSRRGTFSHRHAVLVDQATGREWMPFAELAPAGAAFMVYDSLLSEYAVLGFEYGYSLQRPRALVMWEAQFGDFANGAQIIIDQFLAAATEKWGQRSSLVLLLPHGFEGQGPEHSSARLERFLQLCAGDNLRVLVPSTAAQHYHLLRAQARCEPAVPCVVMTPKSLLRLPAATSRAHDLAGAFRTLLPDPAPPAAPTRLVLCAGKVFYDLLEGRAQQAAGPFLLRVEQLAPFPTAEVAAALAALPTVRELVWVQEEPANMGAAFFVLPHLEPLADGRPVRLVSRPASGSPATGSAHVHQAEQDAPVASALDGTS